MIQESSLPFAVLSLSFLFFLTLEGLETLLTRKRVSEAQLLQEKASCMFLRDSRKTVGAHSNTPTHGLLLIKINEL